MRATIRRIATYAEEPSIGSTRSQQVQILKELRHPNIVEIYRVYRHDPAYYYVVLEFLPGSELFDYFGNKVGGSVLACTET